MRAPGPPTLVSAPAGLQCSVSPLHLGHSHAADCGRQWPFTFSSSQSSVMFSWHCVPSIISLIQSVMSLWSWSSWSPMHCNAILFFKVVQSNVFLCTKSLTFSENARFSSRLTNAYRKFYSSFSDIVSYCTIYVLSLKRIIKMDLLHELCCLHFQDGQISRPRPILGTSCWG